MGACGSKGAGIEKLGPEFGQLIAFSKAQDFLAKNVEKLKKQVIDKKDDLNKDAHRLIEDREDAAFKRMKETKDQIEKEKPGQLDKAAALQHKSVDQLLGEKEIKEEFDKLRKEVDEEFQSKTNNVMAKIDQDHSQQRENLDSKKPSVPNYTNLPQNQRERAFKQGEGKFKKEVKQEQKNLKEDLQEKMGLDKYISMFESINLEKKLNKADENVDDILKDAKSMGKPKFLFC